MAVSYNNLWKLMIDRYQIRINFLNKSILNNFSAYAIMPLGKRDAKVPCEQRMESPNRVAPQSGDSFFLFIAAKHPPGYLLLLSSPSNHLMM